MTAAVLVELNAPLVLADLEMPALDVGQVLVKIQCSGICGAQLGVLLGKLVTQITGSRIEDGGVIHVDPEFGCAGADLGLVTENGQIGDAALQHSSGGPEHPVVVALGQYDPLAIRSGLLAQLVGEHLRRHDRGNRNRQLGKQIRDVDVRVHQFQCGVDLAARLGGHPTPRVRDGPRGVVGAEVRRDDREPQPQSGHQLRDR